MKLIATDTASFPNLATDGEALDQARTRDYAGPWLSSGLPVRLVGVNYDPSSRSLDPPLVEEAYGPPKPASERIPDIR